MSPLSLARAASLRALQALPLWFSLAVPNAAQVGEDFVRVAPCPNGGFQPRAATDAAGVIHLLYLTGEPANADLFYVHSKDVGATFSAPVRVNDTAGGVDGSTSFRGGQFAVGEDGTVHVAWLASEKASPDPARHPVAYARLAPEAQAFEPARNVVQRRFGMDGTPAIVARGEKVLVFWHAPGDELMPAFEPKKPKGGRRQDEPPAEETEESEEADAPDAVGDAAAVPLCHVWMAASDDGGATFAEERRIDSRGDGASPGCGMAAAFDSDGTLFAFYRSHLQRERNSYFLISEDGGETFEQRFVDLTKSIPEIHTSSFLTLGPRGLLAAWESKGVVAWAKVRKDTDRVKAPMAPKETQGWLSRPALAENSKEGLVLAWFEGTAQKPERLAWQVFAAAFPTAVTVAISVLPPRSMLIFWPTAKPSTLCTGRLVVPAGKSSHGPVETLMNTLVGAVAAVPALLTMRRSPPTTISAPGPRPVVLRRLTVAVPAAAGAASPELARPRR
jgi:hypothetical protein